MFLHIADDPCVLALQDMNRRLATLKPVSDSPNNRSCRPNWRPWYGRSSSSSWIIFTPSCLRLSRVISGDPSWTRLSPSQKLLTGLRALICAVYNSIFGWTHNMIKVLTEALLARRPGYTPSLTAAGNAYQMYSVASLPASTGSLHQCRQQKLLKCSLMIGLLYRILSHECWLISAETKALPREGALLLGMLT